MRPVRTARRWLWLAGIGLALAAWWWASSPLAAPLPVDAGGTNAPALVALEVPEAAVERVMAPEVEPVSAANERANEVARGTTVRVVDALGVVVEGAEVQWSRGGESEPFARGTTGADGTCAFTGRERELWVRAHHEAIGTSVQVQVPRGDAVLVLPLLRPVWVRGRVELRDPPVGQLVVDVKGELLVQRAEVGVVAPPMPIVVADDGTFGFEAAAGATLKLSARDERAARVPEQKEVVVDGLEVVLAALDRFEVHGVVLDEHGAPLVGQDVPAFGGWSSVGKPIPFVLVGEQTFAVRADGSFAATAARSPTRAHAWLGNRTSPTVDITFAPGQRRQNVVLQLPAMLRTSGQVVGADGTPGAGRSVKAVQPGVMAMPYSTQADANGRFALELPSGLRWSLSIDGRSVEVVAGQQDVVVVWGETERWAATGVRLEVVGANGRELGFPRWEWWRLDGDSIVREGAKKSRIDRQWWIDELRFEPWTLVVADGPTAVHHAFTAGAVPSELRLELQPPASLQVTVQRAGKPVRGLDVLVDPCGPNERADGDDKGVFRLSYVTPGPAFVRVRRGAEVLVSRAVELVAGQRTAIAIEVP